MVSTSRGRSAGSGRRTGRRRSSAADGETAGGAAAVEFFAVFEFELQLPQVAIELLRLTAELLSPQLRDEQFEVLDLDVLGMELPAPEKDEAPESVGVEALEIGSSYGRTHPD
jgi:hypothetical protein